MRKGEAQPSRTRTGRGLVPLSNVIGPAAAATFARFGALGHRIVTRWPMIVGPQLAERTLPLRLVRGPQGGHVLRVRVDGAAALHLQHQAPQIVDRINTYFGGEPVARLVIEQGPVPRRPPPPREPPVRALTAEERAALETRVAGITDPGLKAALVALGTRILLRESDPQRFD